MFNLPGETVNRMPTGLPVITGRGTIARMTITTAPAPTHHTPVALARGFLTGGVIGVTPAALVVVRLHLLGQESPHTTRRRARDLYEAHTARLVTAGVLAQGEVVGLGALGLLTSLDAEKPVAELSMGQQRRLDLAVATHDRQMRRDIRDWPRVTLSPWEGAQRVALAPGNSN